MCRYVGVHKGVGMQKHACADVCTRRYVSVQVHGYVAICVQGCGYADTWVCRCNVWVPRVYECTGVWACRYTGTQVCSHMGVHGDVSVYAYRHIGIG